MAGSELQGAEQFVALVRELPGVVDAALETDTSGRIDEVSLALEPDRSETEVVSSVCTLAKALGIAVDEAAFQVQHAAADRRPARRTRQEIKQGVLEAADAAVRTRGLPVRLEGISLEELIQEAKVPRTSAYRVWRRKDEFLEDVAGVATKHWRETVAIDKAALSKVWGVIRDSRHDLHSVEGRRSVLHKAVMKACALELARMSESQAFRNYLVLCATASSSQADSVARVTRQRLQAAETDFLQAMIPKYQLIIQEVGFRPKVTIDPAFDEQERTYHFALVAQSLLEGFALRVVTNPSALDPQPGSSTSDREWTIFGDALLGLIDHFAEPLPDWKPRPDPVPDDDFEDL